MPRETSGAGWVYTTYNIHAPVVAGTSAEEYLTDLIPGFRQVLVGAYATVEVAGTGSSASRSFRVIRTRGTTDTTMASKTIALADTATKGATITLTNSTTDSDLHLIDTDKLTIDVASGGTSFTALTINFTLVFRTRMQQYT